MRIQLLGEISGTRNGLDWPPRGTVVDLPDEEAARLCEQQMARPVALVAETVAAVVEPVEDRRVLDGSGLVPGHATPVQADAPFVGEQGPEPAARGKARRA